VDVVAPDATLTDVTDEPPDSVWNTHVAPLALTSNSNAKPDGLVDSVNVYALDETVSINNVPPIAPPVTAGCALCTANPDEVTVTEESTPPTAVTVDELLDAAHSM
jgi:hypothetical protein